MDTEEVATEAAGCVRVLDVGALAFRAGELLAQSGTTDVLDALVALTVADRPGWEVVTSDPDDINHLLTTLRVRRIIRRV